MNFSLLTKQQPYQRLSDVIPDRERGWLEIMMGESPSRVNSATGRGLIIHDLFGKSVSEVRKSTLGHQRLNPHSPPRLCTWHRTPQSSRRVQ